jgi:serine/threonine-protein kinase RsbW
MSGDVTGACAFIEQRTAALGFGHWEVQRMVAAASELVANVAVHGTGDVQAAVWREADDLMCQIEDEGDGPADAPWGLWLSRAYADVLELGRCAFGSAARLRVTRGAAFPAVGLTRL